MKSKTLLIIIGALCVVVLARGGALLFNLGRQSAQQTNVTQVEAAVPLAPTVPVQPDVSTTAPPPSDPAQLVEQWGDTYEACRGGSGDDPATTAACNLNDQIGRKLEAANWCYTPFEWKPCR